MQGPNVSPNNMRPNLNQFNQNINQFGFNTDPNPLNGLPGFQSFNPNGRQNGMLPNPELIRQPQQALFLPFNNNGMQANQAFQANQSLVNQQNQPFMNINPITSPLQPTNTTVPVKPSTVYLNPSFIAKQKKSDPASRASENRQNVLKDSNNSSNNNSAEKYTKSAKSPNATAPKPRSKIDLNALLEKRLADELKEEAKTS